MDLVLDTVIMAVAFARRHGYNDEATAAYLVEVLRPVGPRNSYVSDLDIEAYLTNPPTSEPTPEALATAERLLDANIDWVDE